MSLDYDLRTVSPEGKKNPKAQYLIFITMLVGMGEITKNNYEEFYDRVWQAEAVCGLSLGESYTTLEDVKMLIGLKTNVYPKWSTAKFEGHMRKVAFRRAIERRRENEAQKDKES